MTRVTVNIILHIDAKCMDMRAMIVRVASVCRYVHK